MTLDIILSVYNGEKYLSELLTSLVNQTSSSFKLLVRDDGSYDESIEIVDGFKDKLDIVFVNGSVENLGVVKSFSYLLEQSNADLIMFADQDDVWLPEKIENAVKSLKNFDTDLPLMGYSDLKVTDEKLNITSDSFVSDKGFDSLGCSFASLLLENRFTGCTLIINNAMKELVLPIPASARMHDWWIALCAYSMGVAVRIPETDILYRQHASNIVGSNGPTVIKRMRNFRELMGANYTQAEVFLNRYRDILDGSCIEVVENFLKMKNAGFIKRNYIINKNSFKYCSSAKNLFMRFLA